MNLKKIGPSFIFSCLLLLILGSQLASKPASAHQGIIGHGYELEPEIEWDAENQLLAVKARLYDAEHQVNQASFQFIWMRYRAERGIACQLEDFNLNDNLEAALVERGFGTDFYQEQKDVYYSNSLGGLLKEDENGPFIFLRDILERMEDDVRAGFVDGPDILGVCFLLSTEDQQHLILKELILSAAQIQSGSLEPLESVTGADRGQELIIEPEESTSSASSLLPASTESSPTDNQGAAPGATNQSANSTWLVILGAVLLLLGLGGGIVFYLTGRRRNKDDLPPMY